MHSKERELLSPMASTEVNDRDLSALRVELGNRIAGAESRTRAELRPLAIQVEAVSLALEKMRERAKPAPAPKPVLTAGELDEIRDEIESLEAELASLLERVEALEKRPPAVQYVGGGGGYPVAGPDGQQGPAGPPGEGIDPGTLAPASAVVPEFFLVFQSGQLVKATYDQMVAWLGSTGPGYEVTVNGEAVTVGGVAVTVH